MVVFGDAARGGDGERPGFGGRAGEVFFGVCDVFLVVALDL